jgi:hypothetical protein
VGAHPTPNAPTRRLSARPVARKSLICMGWRRVVGFVGFVRKKFSAAPAGAHCRRDTPLGSRRARVAPPVSPPLTSHTRLSHPRNFLPPHPTNPTTRRRAIRIMDLVATGAATGGDRATGPGRRLHRGGKSGFFTGGAPYRVKTCCLLPGVQTVSGMGSPPAISHLFHLAVAPLQPLPSRSGESGFFMGGAPLKFPTFPTSPRLAPSLCSCRVVQGGAGGGAT